MKKIGIFYWPLKGNVEKTAQTIAGKLEGYDVTLKNLGEITWKDLMDYDYLVFGNSTVGAPNWEDATQDNKWYMMFHDLEQNKVDFGGKKVAFFSLGDMVNYPHHFVDSLELVYSHLTKHNLIPVGKWKNEGYEFYESKALDGDYFYGLVLDLDNQEETLEPYTDRWVEMIKKEFV